MESRAQDTNLCIVMQKGLAVKMEDGIKVPMWVDKGCTMPIMTRQMLSIEQAYHDQM